MKPAHTPYKPKNTPRYLQHESDPAGTSPYRYAGGTKAESNNDYSRQPDNHPAANERLIEPNRGE
jgi:hypothetical protein